MYVALATAQWVVAKALAPVADGVLGAWVASRNFGLNIEALSTELLLVKATLEQAALKELGGPAMEMLLQKLRYTAHNAEDLLDKLDYFRIHDKLHGTYDAADKHGKGSVRNLAFNAHHTAKAVGKLVNCCTWQRGKHQQRSCGDSSSPSFPNQEVSRCMPKFSKLLPCLASSHPHDHDADCGTAQETPKLDFNRVDFSQRMKDIIEKLQFMRNEVNKILQGCGPRIVPNIAHSRPISKGQIDEPKLYGRDCVINSIIHDITKGQYCDKGLSVLPVVGPGGMGKTTLIQHIYRNQQVQNHFSVKIWICVSLNFNLDKVLEHIKRYTPRVEREKECTTTEDLIEHRLKSKRFLFVLDDIWQISSGDWKKLLLTLNQSQEKGCMILVTTWFRAIAQEVITTGHPIELNGLESKEFSKLFLAFIFDDEQCASDNYFLLETGDKIMEKLKGSPLAAKTVGRLLSKDLSLSHWRSILKSKEWEKQTDNNEIMPALKLSYDFLPFHLQQCFSYSGLFPEDCYAKSHDLVSLWIGLDILIPTGQNPTFEDIGLRNLNDLVIHGFFKEEETDVGLCYVMHDLLHDLALKVASHDCLSLHLPDVGSIEIQPSTRHLCISTKNLDKYDPVFGKNLKSELEELKTKLKVEHLHTLILIGELDESSAKIFGEFLWEANALRVLYLPDMMHPVESILNKFSGLVHLRCIYLGTRETQLHLPHISNFYHLKILNLESWNGNRDFPEDMSNLVNLCHFFTPIDDEVHYDICNVGDLKLLEELKVFRVNNKSEGFEPKQLEHLTKLRELGIYNLEKINTKEEATQAKLIEKKYLKRLTLGWDIERSCVKPSAEAVVLESLQPHGDLQVLCIRGHGGPSCPTWLGDEFAVEALQSLYLYGVSWETFPSLGKAWDLHELRLEHIARLKEFIVEKSFCRLTKLILSSLESFEKWIFASKQESSPGGDLLLPNARIFPLLQVLIIIDCPKLLGLPFSNDIVSLDWFPKLQELEITDCPEFSSMLPVSWIENLRRVTIKCVKLLEMLEYRNSFYGILLNIHGKAGLHSLDQVLVFNKETSLEKLTLERCPPLELKHLLMLTSLKKLVVKKSVSLVGPLGVQSDVEGGVRAQHIRMGKSSGNSGKELTELLPHLPSPSKLEIRECKNMTQLIVFPLLQVLIIRHCPELLGLPFSNHIVFPDWFPKVQDLEISDCPEFSSTIPISWIESLCFVTVKCVKLLEEFAYSKSSDGGELKIIGKGDLRSFDQVLVLDKETSLEKLTLERCPPLELKHLLMLTSLKTLIVNHSDDLVGQLGGQGDAEWKLPFWFPKLQKLEIRSCPEFSPVIPVSWIESLRCVIIEDVKLLKRFAYSKSSNGGELEIIGEGDLHSLGQVLFFDKETCIDNLTLERCPPLELKHLLMLTSLKTLSVQDSESLVGPLGGQGNVEWQLPIEHIWMSELNGNIGEELTELLLHLPKLSALNIYCCKNLKKLVLGVDVQKTSEASEIGGGETIAAPEEEDDGLLLFPAHLCETLQRLEILDCPELVLVDQPNIVPGGGWFQALRSLRILKIGACLKFLSAFSFPGHLFSSSLRLLELSDVEGMGTLEPLSNLSSLIRLYLHNCRGDLKCEGLQSIITSGGQLNNLHVTASPKFFVDWNPNPRQASEDVGGEEHQKQLVSSTLQELYTDDVAGLLAAPICSFLSTSLTNLKLHGDGLKGRSQQVKRFSKEQEDALQLLSSLQELGFWHFNDLQQLPAGLHNLTSLKILLIRYCPDISSLPIDGLPESLRELNVEHCRRLELEQQCSGLDGTTPEINIC